MGIGGFLKQEIYDYIQSKKHVSFIELERNISGFKGGFDWGATLENGSIEMYWQGISIEAIYSLTELAEEDNVFATVCDRLIYVRDGEILKFPVKKNNTPHKNTRWLPLTFSTLKPN